MTDSRPQANQNNGVYAGGDGLVWHPAIRALGWVKDWIVWATFVAVLWEFASIGLDPVTRVISFGSVVIRLGVVCAALVGLVIPIYLFHTWLWAVQLIRKNHPVLWFSAMVITTVTAIVLVIGGMYGWMIQWMFHWLWPLLNELADRSERYELPNIPIWIMFALLAAEIPVAFLLLRPIAPKHLRLWRLLGSKRALKGYGVMVILRLRQPRKDFFCRRLSLEKFLCLQSPPSSKMLFIPNLFPGLCPSSWSLRRSAWELICSFLLHGSFSEEAISIRS